MSAAEPTYVYRKYFQKSLNFLYPLLGFAREETFRPYMSYLWWPGQENIDTLDLIVFYQEASNQNLFELFERKVLCAHEHLESCYKVDGGRIYIFSMAAHADTVEKFLRGRYSQFNESVKKRILNYHGTSLDKIPRPGRLFHTSLYPEYYWEQVAREIKMNVEDLKEVGELCSIFDKEKETLQTNILEKCSTVSTKQVSLPSK